jgi:signal transduction histidine kinase
LKEKEDLLADATAANIAKSQFISVMNHELRTPLSSIRGAVALLNAGVGGEQSAKSQRLIDIAQNNSEQLSELIQDLLDVEKFSTGTFSFEPEIVNLADFVRGEMPAYTALGETYDVEFVLGDLAPGTVCNVDPVRLRQILTNLVSNAAKFSAAGMKVNISLEQPSDTIILRISDTGIGIPEDAKQSIFDAFYQVDSSNERNVGGTGLGLRIAKLIVERMGGNIWFDSEVGVGTTFYVSFPCRADLLDGVPS